MLFCGTPSSDQEKVNITAGAGFPEALNLGVLFQHKQTQIGFCLGAFLMEDESFFSVSSDFYYHFGGLSDLSERFSVFNYETEKDIRTKQLHNI